MATDEQIQRYIGKQFMNTSTVDFTGEEGAVYRTYEFNTALHTGGEGDFRLTIVEFEDGALDVVDYEALP
jgi:hypothetical protein